MILVFHMNEVWHSFSGRARPTFPDEYHLVAQVDSDDLGVAFKLTNHIDSDWWNNEKVVCFNKKSRSTSIGDAAILVTATGSSNWLCAGEGWEPLGGW